MNKERQLKDIIRDLAETSSVPGIHQIVSSKQVAIKLLWSLMLLTTTGVVTFQLYELFQDYYSYPIKTKVSLEFNALPFPSVSFCNMNPIKKSMLKNASDALKNVIYPGEATRRRQTTSRKQRKRREMDPSVLPNSDFISYTPDVLSPFETTAYISPTSVSYMETSYLSDGYGSKDYSDNGDYTSGYNEYYGGSGSTGFYNNYWDWSWPTYYYSWSDSSAWAEWSWGESASYHENYNNPYFSWEEYYYDEILAPKDKWLQRIERFKSVFKNESQELRESMGHHLEDFVHSASFSVNKLDNGVFKQFNTADYGNCYTLSSRKFIAWRSGPNYGIQLTLNLEKDEYIEHFVTGYGVRLVIHEPGTYPFPSEEGMTLNPGYETSIGLKLVSVSRLSEPHGKCTDGRDFLQKFQYRYTIQACMQICLLMKTVDQCACAPPESPDINLDDQKYRVCNDNGADKTCMLRVNLQFDQGDLQCDCSPPCKESVYEKTISGRSWPNTDYLTNVLIREMCERANNTNSTSPKSSSIPCQYLNNKTFDTHADEYHYNFLRVVIYFEDLNFESIQQEPLYEATRFLSDIGGALGLFTGASVLSIVELLQLVAEIIIYFSDKRRGETKVEAFKQPVPD